MRFAHVSDLHLTTRQTVTASGSNFSEVIAEAIVLDLIALAETLDLVVVSGDLTEQADLEAFEAFERLFLRTGLPVVLVPGNHDGPGAMRTYAASSEVLAGWNITNRAVEICGVRFFGLDTCVEGRTEGAVSELALSLVQEEVARNLDKQLFLVMHHPPLVLGLEQFDGFCHLERRQNLLDILVATGNQVNVISGHVHRPYFARKGNVACYVAGSLVAPQESALPFGTSPIRPAELQDFYFVHDVHPCGRHVVTPQRIRGLAAIAAVD